MLMLFIGTLSAHPGKLEVRNPDEEVL